LLYAALQDNTRNTRVTGKNIVHSGGFGTGAFGNNAVLMYLVQLLAATFVGVDVLEMHTFDASGTRAYRAALALYWTVMASCAGDKGGATTSTVVDCLFAMKFVWGTSNGT
jgi:hypothetical protein